MTSTSLAMPRMRSTSPTSAPSLVQDVAASGSSANVVRAARLARTFCLSWQSASFQHLARRTVHGPPSGLSRPHTCDAYGKLHSVRQIRAMKPLPRLN